MSERAELLKLHDWDELLFGGFYCLHCTPDDEDDFDEPIAWPCPPLREAGVTDEEARTLIAEHREKVAAEYQAKKAAEQAELQHRVDEFNARYPVGTTVFAYPGCRPEDDRNATRLATRTRSKASVLSGHTDVVWVDGHSACIALSHVDVVTEDEWNAQTAEAVAECGALPVPAGPACPSDDLLADYAALDFAELMEPEAATVVTSVCDPLVAEIKQLRKRIAELETERHVTNEALDDAVQALRARGHATTPAFPYPNHASQEAS